jgi:hypothetical protein
MAGLGKKVHEPTPQLIKSGCISVTCLSSQLCGKHKLEDPSPGGPGHKFETLFDK